VTSKIVKILVLRLAVARRQHAASPDGETSAA